MVHTLINDAILPRKPFWTSQGSNRSRVRLASSMATVALVAFSGWFFTSTSVVDLAMTGNQDKAELSRRWAQGDLVVMIRHAERCDRSGNPCMASLDGITQNGAKTALAVGTGLQQLGLQHTRIIAGPLTRTQQTADLIFARVVPAQDWVSDCKSGFKDAVLANKKPQENLVLITHSGCIDQFERKMGVRSADRNSEYTQAFFVQVDGRHAPKILGSLDSTHWQNLTTEPLNP